ncbi:hypothetical protein AX774_g212 [Zancudomyces culisetae]|uniref:HTH cro/C1-type domain-containing protein n=1 Tax=Zancudomyces culisetae TaxID=1213189 RepID=A0A1R1PZE0_ZANCU|nr:hypothetical protein AX774_g212 [Zancudomyces culisetae]|eukprot:OMH86320.1 hypothetical protein AX774_g212 [Zancudomyces culisetae]
MLIVRNKTINVKTELDNYKEFGSKIKSNEEPNENEVKLINRFGSKLEYSRKLLDGSIFSSRIPLNISKDKGDSTVTIDANGGSDKVQNIESLRSTSEPQQNKRTNLTQEQISEIRELRSSDPTLWTCSKLSEKFNVSPIYIRMISQAPAWRREELAIEREIDWNNSGYKKRLIRINRIRRKLAW